MPRRFGDELIKEEMKDTEISWKLSARSSILENGGRSMNPPGNISAAPSTRCATTGAHLDAALHRREAQADHVEPGQSQGREQVLDPNEVTLVRGAGGSGWAERQGRPEDVGAACDMSMTWTKDGPTVQNIKHCNKVIQDLTATSVYLRVQPIDLHDGMWVVFSDDSLGDDGDKSQGGFRGCSDLNQQLEEPPFAKSRQSLFGLRGPGS